MWISKLFKEKMENMPTQKIVLKLKNGVCLSCIGGYYFGLDNRCIDVENYKYSETYYECKDCKDGFYYNRKIKQCL